MIREALEEIGLSEKEVSVYLTLLEIGSGKVQVISRISRLNRTSIYDILESLTQKGLVSRYKKGGASYFNALEPDRLLTYLDRETEERQILAERQKGRIADILPQLVSMQDIYAAGKPKVRFFEGEKGMREAYEDTLTTKETILAYANVQTMHEGLPEFFPEYYRRRAGKDIFIQAIVPQNRLSYERSKHDQEEMRSIRFLPDAETDFSPEVNIYENKVLIASWKEKMAIIIESKELADLQRLTFELLWKTLPRHISEPDA
jgi:sugar-specific transcriptional regulator TrmB